MKKYKSFIIMLIFALAFILVGCNKEAKKPEEDVKLSKIILSGESKVKVGSSSRIEVAVQPENAKYDKIEWSSNDDLKATVDNGVVTIKKAGKVTITAKVGEIQATFVIDGIEPTKISLSVDGKAIVEVGKQIQINAETNAKALEWSSSDESILTVDNKGMATGVAVGNVVITAKDNESGKENQIAIAVKDFTTSKELLELIEENHKSSIMYKSMRYIGFETGYQYKDNKRKNIYGSANRYWAAKDPEIIKNMLDLSTAKNYSKGVSMDKVEYIIVHDTAGGRPGSTARANSNWCTNPSNTGTSWHYTIGNDGVFQQLEHNIPGWHAGDGLGTKCCDIDTGVKAKGNNERPVVTISDDGYFVLDGVKSTYVAPKRKISKDVYVQLQTKNIAETGMLTTIGANGNYHMHAYYNSSYKRIASYCGLNSIGIETAVNYGSDLYLTWQMVAKTVANLQIQEGLTYQRLAFHNTASGKPCPNTMIHADMVEEFKKMVKVEWLIKHDFSDYEVKFESKNKAVLGDDGRVVGKGPSTDTKVDYVVTVTNGKDTASKTFTTKVPGR